MHQDLVAELLSALVGRADEPFNVFHVMRHGTHEKQLSNVFAWLLDVEGTHGLGDAFQRIFIEEAGRGRADVDALADSTYRVSQEVDVSAERDRTDIADLVLEGPTTTFVVENYYTSSGHGHIFSNYWNFGKRGDTPGVVVMLCENEDPDALTHGWKGATVVTYATLLKRLRQHVESDDGYRLNYPDQCAFYEHMHHRFVGGRRVNDENLVSFLNAMCRTGEAERYRGNKQEDAATNFGNHVGAEAVAQYGESRELLRRLKRKLSDYGTGTLRSQVNCAVGTDLIGDTYSNYGSIWEWTVGFCRVDDPQNQFMQFKFGPSAWYANERRDGDFGGEKWENTVPPSEVDYSRLFLTWRQDKSIRQTDVSLLEFLGGLADDDFRLRDQVVNLIRSST